MFAGRDGLHSLFNGLNLCGVQQTVTTVDHGAAPLDAGQGMDERRRDPLVADVEVIP